MRRDTEQGTKTPSRLKIKMANAHVLSYGSIPITYPLHGLPGPTY